jgi:tRNA(His) 5'-end guanylyltransferase
MKSDDLEARMRAGECYHSLRVPPAVFPVVRVDGRSFSGLTERLVEKPFDPNFHSWMIKAAEGLLVTLHGVYAYTESDEISVLLSRDADLFDREVEKLVSIASARASAIFSMSCGEAVEFDARLWVGARTRDVVDYFRWRQTDATRCALNGWCYWTLRGAGKSAREATRRLEGATVAAKNELLFSHGINFNTTPHWQRRGTGLYWGTFEKDGFNPKTGNIVKTTRRRIVVNEELPTREEYGSFIKGLVDGESPEP